MPIHNADIARIFNKVADLLEIDGANPFWVRSYRNAAWGLGENVLQGVVNPDEYLVFKLLLGQEGVTPIIEKKMGGQRWGNR